MFVLSIKINSEDTQMERLLGSARQYRFMALNLDSTIADLLREKPESAAILQSFGMGCLGCAIANNETIREAAMVHGIPIDELAAKLGF